MLFLQGLKLLLESLLSPYVPNTMPASKLLTMGIMILLTLFLFLFISKDRICIPYLPDRFTGGYILLTAVSAVLCITAPANFTEGLPAILMPIYGSIVTPVYEELLFRGLLWENFREHGLSEKKVYLLITLLFSIWHLGYMPEHLAAFNLFPILMKLIAALIYGMIPGFVRLKTKNIYAPILLHGLMNLFMV